MKKYPQPIKRQLHELALLAVEKELTLQLSELSEQFEIWKRQEISNRGFRHVLHNYVAGPSQELFRRHRDVEDCRISSAKVHVFFLTIFREYCCD